MKILLLFLIITFSLNVQAQSGIITYKGMVNEKFVDSFLTAYKKKKSSMLVKQRVVKAFKNAISEEFILNFKDGESYYYKKPNLEQEGYLMGSRAGTTPYYTNSSKDLIIEMSRSLGKIAHKPLEWEITNETKEIGNYRCRKAVTTEKLFHRKTGDFYYRETIAWFTPEIPLNFGPKHYKGLPGLILQIQEKEFTLTATKINLNPEDDMNIKRVNDDEIITQQESFNRIKGLQADMDKKYGN